MLPSIAPGDWLLVDPTVTRWPRRGSVVVVREPDSGQLAIKRVAAGPGSFVVEALAPADIADAMLRKFLLDLYSAAETQAGRRTALAGSGGAGQSARLGR